MLVKFTSPAHSDFTMFANVAVHLLKMMGQSGAIPGGISAEDVPVVLEHIQELVKGEKDVVAEDSSNDSGDKEEDELVNIELRAFPLIEMLKAAAEEKSHVMWYEN
jgi:Domain of unknown function (DUF1840)